MINTRRIPLKRKSSTKFMEDTESEIAHQNVTKPPGDWRNFRAISLLNQLKVLLISDKQAAKAAAALGIHAGSMLDPPDLEGLSHLCQHMLLSGRSKFGEQMSFEEHLNEYGGEYNGSSHRDVVIHGFQVAPNLLAVMLTHFSQFITHPSFPSGRLIEAIKKIQIEYENRAVNDEEREWRVISSVVDVTHPYSRFDCGNRYTLWDRPIGKKVNILEKLKEFHAQHYSANLMSLVVLGRESLEELETLTRSLFSEIFNADLPYPSWPSSPLTDNELPLCIDMVPLTDKRHLQLLFPVPDCTECFKNGAVPYIRYVLSYEGPRSLVTTLKSLHLISKAEVDYDQPASGFAFINIQLELTREGVEKSNDIITTFFQYVKMLRKNGPQKNIWKELRNVNETRFMFSKMEAELTFVENLVTLLPLVPAQEVLSCRYLFTEYNPEVIRYLMDCIVPHRMLSVTSWNGFGPIADKVEKWYGTRYKQTRFGESVLQRWYACPPAPHLSHPPPNPFVATEFYLKSKEVDSDVTPMVLDEDEFSRVWYFQDDRFAEPQASIVLHIISPLPRDGPTEYVLAKLMAKIISEEFLTEFTSSAHEAGLWYSLEASTRGLTITTHGYNHKLHLLFNYVLNRLFHFVSFGNVGPNFENVRNDYVEELQKIVGQEPSVCATELVEQLMTQDFWTSETTIREISKIDSPSMLTAYASRFFSFVRLHWLFHGNYSKKEAMNIYRTSMEYFHCVHCKPLPISKIASPPPTTFPTGTTTINRNHAGSAESTAVKVIQAGNQPPTPRDVALLEMIEHLLYDPAIEILRENASCIRTDVKRTSNDKLVLIILVQSIDDPVAIQQKIDGFLLAISTMILNLRRWEFLDHRLSFGLHKADTQPKSLWAASSEVFQEIFNETYNFDRSKKEIMTIQSIEYAEMKAFFDKWIHPRSSNKKCYCINIIGTGSPRNQAVTVPFEKRGSWHNPILEEADTHKPNRIISSAILEATEFSDSAEDTTATKQDFNFQQIPETRGSTSSCAKSHSRSSRKGPSLNVSRKHSQASSSKLKHSFRPLSRGKLASSLNQTKAESIFQSEAGGSSDADSQNIQRYYMEVEEELEKLTHIKVHLMSTIQKTNPQLERTEDTKWDVPEGLKRAKLQTEASPMTSNPINGEGFPEVEYQVYTLPSIIPVNQDDRKGTSSRRSLRSREQDAGDNKNEILRALPSSLKPGGKYYNSLQPTLSRIMKRVERTKGAAAKIMEGNVQRRESKKMEVNAESKKFVKSERRKSSKGNSKASLSSGSPRATKVFPAVSKNEQVAEIEELDFDIQEEISRLQKIRKLLDAKAKRILRKEEEKAMNNNNNMSVSQLVSKSDKKLNGDSQDSEQVVFPGNVMDAKLARKVEMTVIRAKKALEEDMNQNKNPDGLSLEELEKQISAARREDRATAVVNMLHQLDTKVVENTARNTPGGNPDENPVTSNEAANPLEVNKFKPSRKDSEDGSFRHQDLIQWLQGMFPDKELDHREEPVLDEHKRRTDAEVPRNQQPGTSMGSSLRQAKANDVIAEQITPKLEMSNLPVLTESELKIPSNSPLNEASLKKPKVIRKVVEPPPQTSTPSVSANPSTAKPISRNSMKPQQVITQNGISPKFPLKIHQSGKPPFNLSTKVRSNTPPKKVSKTFNKNTRKPGTPKNSSFPLRPIRKRSDSNTSSPRKTSEADKIDLEKPKNREVQRNIIPTVAETNDKDSYREAAADSKLETQPIKRETKRALSDAKLIKMKHRSEIMRPTSSERDVVERKSHQISDSIRQLSCIGASDDDSRVSRSPRRNSSMMKPSRRSRSRRSSSIIASKLLRKRSKKDVSPSKHKSRKDKKDDVVARHRTTRRHGGFHVSSSDDADRERWESDSPDDNASHKSTSRKSVASRKGVKSTKKLKRPKKLRQSGSKESEISEFQSPPSPISVLGNKQRLKISEYDVLATDQRHQQTWETLKVNASESVTRRTHLHESPILGNMPELKFQRSYPRRANPTSASKVNISERILSDLKSLNESVRDLPLRGLHLPSKKFSKTIQ